MEKVIVTQEEFKKIVSEYRDKYVYYATNKQPVANFIDSRKYEEWFLVEEEHKIYVVPKNKFDFSEYDYLPDMVGFMEDVKYMFDNHNSPNNYPFTKVQLAFDRLFQKGVVQAEEVKNGLGETFQTFIPVWIEAYSLMVGKECQLKDFFKAIEEGLYVKDILPFVAKVVKEKIDRPVFKLDEEKLDRLSTTLEFNRMKNWLLPFVSTLQTSENNYVVDKNVMVLLITHICLNMSIEFEQGGSEGCRKQAENLLKEYRRIFEIDGRNPADNSEFYSKLSAPVANYRGWASHEIDVENPTKLDKSKMFDGWYEVGYILGSPKGQKLF